MEPEIVLIIGCSGSGKSTLAEQYIQKGYHRLNRDIIGGTLDGLLPRLKILWEQGVKNFVLDNTYINPEARAPIIALSKELGVNIGCVVPATSFDDCTFNVCTRMVQKLGYIPAWDVKTHNKDKTLVPPAVLYSFKKQFRVPLKEEGFTWIKYEPFVRIEPPYENKALILDADGTVRYTKSKEKYPCNVDDIAVYEKRIDRIKEYANKGYKLLGVSNQSGVAGGEFTAEECKAMFDRTNELLGLDIEWNFCPHRAFPYQCWCRKPLAGRGVELIERHKLNRKECVMVGDMTSDETFARVCGFQFVNALTFFK